MILIIHRDFPSFLSTMTGQSSICCSFEAERSWKSPKVLPKRCAWCQKITEIHGKFREFLN